MKYVSNTTKNPINYKDKVIPPGASVMLNNKGDIIDEVTDNTEEIEKIKGEISKAVTLAQVDTRLEEVECRITNLVTSANSKKEIEGFRTTDFTKLLDPATLLSCANSNVECYYVTECVPVSEYMKGLEPGIYLGQLSKKFCSEISCGVYMYKKGETYNSGQCYARGYISLTARSCLVIPSTCSYGCVQGQYVNGPAFIFQVSEDDIKRAYVCNIIGFEKRCFEFYSSYTSCPNTYGIDNCSLCNVWRNVSLSYCVCDWNNKVQMSLSDYLSREIPELYKRANKNIITTSATKLQ